ncbi:glycerophosphodiester phosphodiesterase family protein [Propioniciclava flava]|uniref:GP-PDE domain-containing protein n=1 Tax=Propioniciclava flava TaxID=2072026 RepID=A0A4Q2EH78_9ACTN|nr:glycerophosphodiester phosphodiesterase family protein [Propioniciclava flava]RXW32781.1 hypothetical protein C1706_06495 [Propioniciclava flava]
MLGDTPHAATNALIHRLVAQAHPLVVSHGGVSVGVVPPNTSMAVRGALLSGADAVKIDVSSSTDHVFYAFHDGTEPELLGVEENIQTLPAATIAGLSYQQRNRPGHPARVERLASVLSDFRGKDVLFALDRSWWRWPTLLKVLDGLQMTEQCLLKVPAWEFSALGKLKAHKVKYPTLAICSTEEELHALPLHDPSINLVGVELIALDEDSAWFDPDVVDALRAESLLIWVNSETLTTGVPLFAGFDDEKALAHSPSAAWSQLLELGVDAIQTEYPWLLHELRRLRA